MAITTQQFMQYVLVQKKLTEAGLDKQQAAYQLLPSFNGFNISNFLTTDSLIETIIKQNEKIAFIYGEVSKSGATVQKIKDKLEDQFSELKKP